MSELIVANDFSAGLTLSDDPINGRKNGLMRFDSLELSKNGVVRMSGGTVRVLSVFVNTLHTIYTKYLPGVGAFSYSADTSGNVFRVNTSIKTGGSLTRAVFNAAYSYVFGFSGDKRFKDDGTTVTDLGIIKPSAAPTVATTTGSLTGDYEYAQINVLVNGSYRAKSARSAISTITLTAQGTTVTPQNPSVPGSTANEAWIFRRGVNLDIWYRIARVTTFGSFTDNMSDSDALALGITMNDFLLSINSTDTPDPIIGCVGLVYGRMIYFTEKQIIFGDIDSPDSYDSRTTINLGAASGGEIFKWAIIVNKKTILVASNKDVYSLNGTFVQLPDGYLDVSLDGLGVENPSLGIDVALRDNYVFYMSKIGWVACGINGSMVPLCPPNIERMYYREPIGGYGFVHLDPTGATRFSCAISKDKLYGIVKVNLGTVIAPNFIYEMHIYDFIRKYWRIDYFSICPLMLFASEDTYLYGFDDVDKYWKRYDDETAKTLDDGVSSQQTIGFRTCFFDDGKPRNKKDIYTLTLRGHTGSASVGVTVKIAFDGSTSFTTLSPTFKGLTTTEQSWDISGGITDPGQLCKCIQVDISGQVPDFELQDISISYDARPISELHLNFQDLGLDSIDKNYISTLNFIINTNGQNVDFYPVIDGFVQTKSTINTSKKLLASHHFGSAPGGNVWTGYFIAQTTTPFEFYKWLPPTLNYRQPQYVKYVEFTLTELFRYGKLKSLEVRLGINASLTSIPYSIIFDNGTPVTGTLTVVANQENIYSIPLPKTTAGSILILQLGATSITFSPIYARVLVVKSGKDTEEQWIALNQGLIK